MPTAKKRATTKKAARKAAVKKAAPAKAPKAKKPSLKRTVNMGPLRGDNSFPPSNKAMPNNTSSSPGGKPKGSPANDSTTGPGGKALEGRARDKKS